MEFGLKGKNIVVTGAAQGIGAAITRSLLDQGAYVYAIDLQDFKGSELSTMTTADEQKNSFVYHKVDASDLDAIKNIFDQVFENLSFVFIRHQPNDQRHRIGCL